MNISVITESIITLFFIILVGVYGNRKKIITAQINKGLIDILIQIALPFMILTSFIFTYDEIIKTNVIKTFYYSIAAYIIMTVVSYLLLLPVKNGKKIVLHFANVFVNTGYVGFPILNSIYGSEGIVYGSIFNMFFVVFVWTYGIILYKREFNKKEIVMEIRKILLNPSIMAVCLGLVIMTFKIQLPDVLLSSVRNIASITGPLSMLIIGAILSEVKIKSYLKDWTLYYGVITKLIIIPLVIYSLSFLIGESSKAINTVIIMAAMPASAMTSILAEQYNIEKDYAAVIVSVTTLLSLITVTFLLKIIL